MRFRQRLSRLERMCGAGELPEVFVSTVYFERRDGGADFGYAWAFVTNLDKFFGPSPRFVSSGEDHPGFVARVCDEVEAHYGARPSNEKKLKEEAAGHQRDQQQDRT